jgi:hypothetical protein
VARHTPVLLVRSTLVLLALTCLTTSCDGSPPAHAPASPARTQAAVPRHVASDTEVAIDQDDCGLVREQRYPDPATLVRDYLRSDTAADYGDTDRLLCPDYAVGSDIVRVVSYLGIDTLAMNPDTARFIVHSEQYGYMGSDSTQLSKFESEHATPLDTFVAVRTEYGWRIAAPLPRVDLTPSHALTGFRDLDAASRDSLRLIAAKVRSGV